MTTTTDFLEVAYSDLGYNDVALGLLEAVVHPDPDSPEHAEWIDKGQWLSAASDIKGVEKIFFVRNEPVVVFCNLHDADEAVLIETYRRVWSMARPQCIFIAHRGSLNLYSLNNLPATKAEELKPLAPKIDILSDIVTKLREYRSEKVQTGELFASKQFSDINNRADKRLISDLRAVRTNLIEDISPKVSPKFVHALISRAIFVRYLEDRDILDKGYVEDIALESPVWQQLLDTPIIADLAPNGSTRYLSRILRDKEFTYRLFETLAEDFNGDMFPTNLEEEKAAITQEHLDRLNSFLLGDTSQNQPSLFLWAYDFQVLPIELISSIYEEFYHYSSDEDVTHYTPSSLVDFMLSNLLTTERLAQTPRILDPACGSGIFLVESYRRIIRYNEKLSGELDANKLRSILRTQIVGIEVNEEAIRIAAFSLYLALLHFQKPRSIREQIKLANGNKPLPNVIFNSKAEVDEQLYFPVLYQANSFDLLNSEVDEIQAECRLTKRKKKQNQLNELLDTSSLLALDKHSFDVVVGNPPWGYQSKRKSAKTSLSKPLEQIELEKMLFDAQTQVLLWCNVKNWSPGDSELSQAFIARSLSFLKDSGVCGFLVSAGVLLKGGSPTVKLRNRWLNNTILSKVVNFSHVRHLYFPKAVSYFAYVEYQRGTPTNQNRFEYWSAKRDEVVENTRSVILSNSDIHRIRQQDVIDYPFLWKTYWWGNHHDANLILKLKVNQTLGEIVELNEWPDPKRGFKNVETNSKPEPSGWLKEFQELPVRKIVSYGKVDHLLQDTVPDFVKETGNRANYEGWRLLILQGIRQRNNANGRIISRLENEPYCFQSSIYGFNVDKAKLWQRKIIAGILWSSLTRYYFFMIGSAWGAFGNKIYLHEAKSLPIRFPNDINLRRRIINIVDRLREWETDDAPSQSLQPSLFDNNHGLHSRTKPLSYWEKELDNAIFDLYDLTERDKDLVLDLCENELEFFYRHSNSEANLPVRSFSWTTGKIGDIDVTTFRKGDMQGYLYTFCKAWNDELQELKSELQWRILYSSNAQVLGVVFSITGDDQDTVQNIDSWDRLLEALQESDLIDRVSQSIYVEGLIRVPLGHEIAIIKRNKRRLWTRSRAHEDVEATKVQIMLMRQYSINQS